MKKLFVIGLLAALFGALVPAAGADSGMLPGGTEISVEIASPVADDLVAADDLVITGEASIGMGAAAKDTSLVYILDVSGSTADSAGVDCDGDGIADTILACEKEAVSRVNAAAALANSPILNSGLGVFNSRSSVLQYLTAPGDAIEAALGNVPSPRGGTDFGEGLSAANSILTAGPAGGEKIVVFLTDGVGSGSSALPAGTVVKAFAIGAATCSGALEAISDTCEVVDDLSKLDEVIGESIGATLDSLTYSVDGGPAQALPTTPSLPQAGPAVVEFEATVDELGFGSHEICVHATGTDAGGSGTIADCVTVEVMQTVVDCSDSVRRCMATGNDGEVSDATAIGSLGFTKTLGVRPAEAEVADCPPEDCFTGYDVMFGGTGEVAVVNLIVVASLEDSTPPEEAAVFMNGVEITEVCHMESTSPVPCVLITTTRTGQTQYFVRFAEDPGFHFK